MICSASVNNQKRIVKNTIMLYIRMAVIMLVTLYISRVVLNVLGETDFGIYNIVGSVVVSLIFIQDKLTGATQRFLSFEIGKNNINAIKSVFSTAFNIHLRFVIAIFIILETIGYWFLNNILSIPIERIEAANVAFQFSVVTFLVNIMRAPYNAVIISFEKMEVYAILSIIEALLKLSIAYVLLIVSTDKLVLYSSLVFSVTLIVNILFVIYCKCKFKGVCAISVIKNKSLFKEMISFTGWNMLSGISGVATNEGPNYLMNIYHGVGINAAMGLAKQVSSAVYQFTANFQTAFNPQIVKAYSGNEKEYLFDLIEKTSLLSFYLLFLFAFPLIVSADWIFKLWLINVPIYSVDFCILIMISQMIAALSSPMWMVVHATGDIKQYQIALTVINLLILPLSWFVLYIGLNPIYVIFSQIVINIFVFGYRLLYLKKCISFDVNNYLEKVIFKCMKLVSLIIPIPLLCRFIPGFWGGRIIGLILSILITSLVFYRFGLGSDSRQQINSFVSHKILGCFKN